MTTFAKTCLTALASLPLMASCGADAEESAAKPTTTELKVLAQDEEAKPAASPKSEPGVRVDAQKLVDFFGHSHYRYIEFEETEELAVGTLTDTGVTGSVEGFEEGPQLWTDGGPNSGRTVIMRVEVLDNFDGEGPSTRMVDVLLPANPTRSAADYLGVLPKGSGLVLYLNDVPADELAQGGSADLLTPVTPQGFAVSDGSGDGVIYPMAHEIVNNESLADQVPPGTDVP